MLTLYNVVSADGFIATEDGKEDFIPDELWNDFIDLCKQNDVLVMGRKTYEAVQNYPKRLTKELENLAIKRIVVTKNQNFEPKSSYIVIHSPEAVMTFGSKILLSSGPELNTAFLTAGLINKIILMILPTKISKGLRVFETEPKLILISEKKLNNGIKQLTYKPSFF